MADTATQQAPAEGRSWTDRLSNWFTDRAADVGALTGNAQSQVYTQIRDSQRPGDAMLSLVRNSEGMNTPEISAQIDNIANDRQFMGALNSALSSDSQIIRDLGSSMQPGAAGGANPQQFLTLMQDPQNRQLMTQVLAKIGENPDDQFGSQTLQTVIAQATASDFVGLNQTVQGMGISNARLTMGATMQGLGVDVSGMQSNPMGAIGSFLSNPNEGIANWINNPNGPMANLSEDNKSILATLVQAFAKMLNIYMPGQGIIDPYLEFAQHYGQQAIANGDSIRGATARHEPNAGTPTQGDRTNVQVSENIRPTSAFNVGGLNLTPAREPNADAPQVEIARVTPPNYSGTNYGGGSLPSLGG